MKGDKWFTSADIAWFTSDGRLPIWYDFILPFHGKQLEDPNDPFSLGTADVLRTPSCKNVSRVFRKQEVANKVTRVMRVEAPRQFLPNVRSSGPQYLSPST